ncbi:MAG: VCBS repeat-containing protein [Thioploca sp.]|nr:VCBS repeat-containing protein [Thioploca sp.]
MKTRTYLKNLTNVPKPTLLTSFLPLQALRAILSPWFITDHWYSKHIAFKVFTTTLLLLSQFSFAFEFQFEKAPWHENPLRAPLGENQVNGFSFVDLDNDKDLDIIIGSNNGALQYYENVGNANMPTFEQRLETANPFNGVDVGSFASPSFADLDNDGDWDAAIGSDVGTIHYYENIGNANQPQFEERTDQPFKGLDLGNNATPSFVDLDNDRDWDVVIGDKDGLHYYENIGDVNRPQYEEHTNHPFNNLNLQSTSSSFTDFDNDGDWDAFIVSFAPSSSIFLIYYYENIGDAKQPKFEKCTDHPFKGLFFIGDVFTNFVDLDNDGDRDIVIIGDRDGLHYYENVGNVNQPQFEERIEQFFNGIVDVNDLYDLNFADLDNDGDWDAFIGPDYYENIGDAQYPQFEKHTESPLSSFIDLNFWLPSWNRKWNLSFVDLNNDGDLDAVIGDVDGTLDYYENIGNAKQPQFEKRTNHPFNGVDEGQNANPSFIDLDNDGDWDAVIGFNNDNDDTIIGVNGTLYYYENVGDANQPQFEKRTNHPFSGIEVGNETNPTFVDLDHDGDWDVFISNQGDTNYYENIGNANQPQFEKRFDHPFSSINSTNFNFVDIDNDGDEDAFIGYYDSIDYYRNTSNANQPQFKELLNQPFSGVKASKGLGDSGGKATPSLVDLDNDGDRDAFIGSSDGSLRYYENIGDANHPQFDKCHNSINPLCQVDVGDNATIKFVDLDNDGDEDAVIGSADGALHYYENVGDVNQPQFAERIEQPFRGMDVGNNANPDFVDLDNDNDWDVFIGSADAKLHYYENVGNANQPQFEKRFDHPLSDAYLVFSADIARGYYDLDNDGSNDSFFSAAPRFVDLDNDSDWDAFVGYDRMLIYYENISDANQSQFEWRPEQYFGGKSIYWDQYFDVNLDFADLDSDGDWDIIIGYRDGSVHYYENIGNANQPQFQFNNEDWDDITMDSGLLYKIENKPLMAVGSEASPSFIDLDNDGDQDIVIGSADGTFHYYQNVGDINQPQFECYTSINPLCNLNVGNEATISFTDLDNDGDWDAVIGSGYTLYYYENIGDANQPRFEERLDHPFNGVKVRNASPSFADLDNDGDLDAIIGSSYGINYYENVGNASQPQFEERFDHPLVR